MGVNLEIFSKAQDIVCYSNDEKEILQAVARVDALGDDGLSLLIRGMAAESLPGEILDKIPELPDEEDEDALEDSN